MVAPFLHDIDGDVDDVVAAASLDCLVDILNDCEGDAHQRCLDLLSPFERIVGRSLAKLDLGQNMATRMNE